HVEFTQFGKKVVFYFVAPARVDFRNLVKDLVGELKLRIELRQISVRDRSASMGALGPCGRELCCSSFLSRYGNVSVKMAKNQNLTLNYSKLNGVCGQLKCCLQYEDEVYYQKRKKLPEEGSFAETLNGEKGKIFRLHLLSEQFDLLTEKGKIKRFAQGYFKRKLKPTEINMPNRFENISDETSIVVGLNEAQTESAKQFENDMLKLKGQAGKYASEVFEELTGLAQEDQQITPQQLEAEKEKELVAQGERPAAKQDFLNPQDFLNTQADSAEMNQTGEAPAQEAAHRPDANKPNEEPGRERPSSRGSSRGPRRGNKRRGSRGKQKPKQKS
ncbi:MAG: regulatory iron-sulfur-containing complex subunit RicT, partial [Bacteriovoracaceae bacterium]